MCCARETSNVTVGSHCTMVVHGGGGGSHNETEAKTGFSRRQQGPVGGLLPAFLSR